MILSNFTTSDYSFWSAIIQFSLICVLLLVANVLRRKIPFLKNMLLPTAIIAGFIGLGLKYLINDVLAINLISIIKENDIKVEQTVQFLINNEFLETITYHSIAIGFIALSLKTAKKDNDYQKRGKPIRSGLVIVNTYLLQGVIGISVTIIFSLIFKDIIARYGGLLLPMGYGQGPGQAGNIGENFEAAGFNGGKAFGLAIAAFGFLWACFMGVFHINRRSKQGKVIRAGEQTAQLTTTTQVEGADEIPLSESIDKLTVQICLVFGVYFIAWIFMYFLTRIIIADSFASLIWGFNFIFGMLFGMLTKIIIKSLQKGKVMKRKYTNEYMLNRITGVAFDFMIVCSIMAIEVENLSWQLLITLIVLTTIGGIVTYFYIRYVCKKVYPSYEEEAFATFFGNLTGTASTGVALLREIDPHFKTPAADDLVFGSSSAVLFGAPILLITGFIYKSDLAFWLSFGILIILFIVFNFLLLKFKVKPKVKKEKS